MPQIGFQRRRGLRAQGCRDCDYGSGGSWNVPGPGSYATEVWNSSSIRGIKINQEHLQLVIHVSARVEAFWILPQVCVRMVHVLSLWNRSTSTQSSTQHGNLLTDCCRQLKPKSTCKSSAHSSQPIAPNTHFTPPPKSCCFRQSCNLMYTPGHAATNKRDSILLKPTAMPLYSRHDSPLALRLCLITVQALHCSSSQQRQWFVALCRCGPGRQ